MSEILIEMQPVESASLAGLGYDAASQTMEVQFRNGSTYRYAGVPEGDFQKLMGEKSKGKAFGVIRTKFKFERMPKAKTKAKGK